MSVSDTDGLEVEGGAGREGGGGRVKGVRPVGAVVFGTVGWFVGGGRV